MGTPEMDIDTPITNFYKDKSIFITGGTGFIGSVLIEKLLFSCSNLKNIYILITPKNGQSGKERLQDLFQTECFQRIRKMKIDIFKKVVAIEGDICLDDLGLSSYDAQLLQKEKLSRNVNLKVSVVFHAAATTNFEMAVADTVNINSLGTRRLLQLARTMQNFQVFVYVSTAYSNCRKNNDIVDEKIYKLPYSVDSALYLLECKPDFLVQYIKEHWPNAYTFSKALAEQIIATEFSDLPVAIVRPSVVLSSVSEPVAGWWRGSHGPTPVIALAARSLLRVWYCDGAALIDTVPVDRAAHFLLAAATHAVTLRLSGNISVQVFNYCSGLRKPTRMGDLFYSTTKYLKKILKSSRIPAFCIITCRPVWYPLLFFFLQTVPVYMVEAVCLIFRKKSRMMNTHLKVHKLVFLLSYFATRQFFIIDRNVQDLCECMDVRDKLIFPCDVKDIDHDKYFKNYALGIKKYVIKEN